MLPRSNDTLTSLMVLEYIIKNNMASIENNFALPSMVCECLIKYLSEGDCYVYAYACEKKQMMVTSMSDTNPVL